MLLEAAKLAPTVILGQTARLVGMVREQVQFRVEGGLKEIYELRQDRLEALFGEHSESVLSAFSNVSSTDDWILASAQKESVGLLPRLRSGRATTPIDSDRSASSELEQ